MNTSDRFSDIEHKIIRTLLLVLLLIACVKLVVVEVLSFTR